jgi:hypothetical protein
VLGPIADLLSGQDTSRRPLVFRRSHKMEQHEVVKYTLAELGEFIVKVGKGGFERLAVIGVSRGGEIVQDAGAR